MARATRHVTLNPEENPHLCAVCFPCKKKPETDEAGDHIKKWLAEEDKKLGPIRSGEVSAALLLLLLIVLWFFLRPGFMPGWADALFPPGYVGSSAVAILVLTLAFLIPIGGDRDGGDNDAAGGAAPRPVEALMTWPHMRTHFPWELVLIMGAGNALSTVANESGLSAWLGEQLAGLDGLGPWPLVLAVCLLLTFLTEVFSDTLLVYIMLPVVADMSVRLGYSPLFLVVPVTMSIITAFMMPHIIGNVVILATGALSVRTLMKIGFVADIVVSFVYTIATNTWLIPLLDLHTLPPEFLPNSTSPDAGNITLVM